MHVGRERTHEWPGEVGWAMVDSPAVNARGIRAEQPEIQGTGNEKLCFFFLTTRRVRMLYLGEPGTRKQVRFFSERLETETSAATFIGRSGR